MTNEKPAVIVIFGASGDLTKRKLLPALFQLYSEKLLPKATRIVGFARKEKSHEQFRVEMTDALVAFSRSKPGAEDKKVTEFVSSLYYQQGSYEQPESYGQLKRLLDEVSANEQNCNRLYYLSTPPAVFTGIISMLGESGMVTPPDFSSSGKWSRVIVEKPFGRDLASAQELNKKILSILDEEQIYRIDHYLGKETVQNIMAFRFGNSIFEPLWNRRYVDHVQVTVAENVSMEGRGGYYDHSGALRDMVQNHILQLVALVAMEPPASFAPKAVRDEKVKVLSALRLFESAEVKDYSVRGQYVSGSIGDKKIADYLNEPGVAADSSTETFVALKLFIDNWRWANVPFYVRTGKALPERLTEINIEFRQPPLALFGHAHHEDHFDGDDMSANSLALRVQPNEAIRLSFGLKIPGPSMILQPTEMDFCYSDVFKAEPPEAYERLILDTLLGDSTLFIRHDEVEAAWRFIDHIYSGWQPEHRSLLHPYRAGGWGPHAADEFMRRDCRKWVKRDR